jgi:hypothetical protein
VVVLYPHNISLAEFWNKRFGEAAVHFLVSFPVLDAEMNLVHLVMKQRPENLVCDSS